MPARILVLCAHPDLRLSRVNHPLLEGARRLAREMDGRLHVRDLYALYPDYHIDVAAEQAALLAADLVVWQHPIHWYGMPPLMKLWVDEVLALGWAYGHDARALAGKDLWLVASAGGSEQAYHPSGYNRHFFDAFLPPYEQTAALVGLRFLPPLVMLGAHASAPEAIAQHQQLYLDRLRTYPDWPELEELPACPACEVAEADRPAPDAGEPVRAAERVA